MIEDCYPIRDGDDGVGRGDPYPVPDAYAAAKAPVTPEAERLLREAKESLDSIHGLTALGFSLLLPVCLRAGQDLYEVFKECWRGCRQHDFARFFGQWVGKGVHDSYAITKAATEAMTVFARKNTQRWGELSPEEKVNTAKLALVFARGHEERAVPALAYSLGLDPDFLKPDRKLLVKLRANEQ